MEKKEGDPLLIEYERDLSCDIVKGRAGPRAGIEGRGVSIASLTNIPFRLSLNCAMRLFIPL